jgi:hypothetical protein
MRVHITFFRCVTPCNFIENTNVLGLEVNRFTLKMKADIYREKFLSDITENTELGTVISRLTKIIRSGITFISRNLR